MDTLAARRQMVDQQIRTWEVLDPRVLDALSAVPREAFVPPEYRELAFADTPIPIGFGQSMLAPKLQGRILQALAPNPTDSALEVGSGLGYLAATLSLLGASTHSIDIHAEFVDGGRGESAHGAGGEGAIRDPRCVQRCALGAVRRHRRHRLAAASTIRALNAHCGSAAACLPWSARRR
jgi:hypothetical protein